MWIISVKMSNEWLLAGIKFEPRTQRTLCQMNYENIRILVAFTDILAKPAINGKTLQ